MIELIFAIAVFAISIILKILMIYFRFSKWYLTELYYSWYMIKKYAIIIIIFTITSLPLFLILQLKIVHNVIKNIDNLKIPINIPKNFSEKIYVIHNYLEKLIITNKEISLYIIAGALLIAIISYKILEKKAIAIKINKETTEEQSMFEKSIKIENEEEIEKYFLEKLEKYGYEIIKKQ